MANWKKVIVSGSAAKLSALTLDTALPVASGGTGASTLTDGGVVVGSGTGAVTSLGQATNGQLIVGSTGADPVLATLTGGANITVTNTAGAISIAASGLGSGTVQSVSGTGTENGITLTSDGDSVNPTLTLGGALTGVGNAQLSNSSVTLGTTTVALGATAASLAGLTTVTATSFSGSFNGDFTGTTNLPDLTSGNGLTGGPYDGAAVATFAVQADGSTLSVGASGVKVADSGITETQIATSVAGPGLSGGAGSALKVNVDDTSIEVATDTLRVKAGGISTAMIAAGAVVSASIAADAIDTVHIADDAVESAQIANNAVTLGTQTSGVYLAGVETTDNGIDITDKSGVGETPTFSIQYGASAGTVAEGNSTVTFTGTANEITVSNASAQAIGSDVSATIGLPDDVTIGQDLTVTRDMLVSRNAVVSGNLTVAGTASFQNTTNLDVADRFIRMASGSTTVGDGGIIVQQTGPADGEAFAYDAAVQRWSMTGSFDPSTEAYTPDSFMSAVVEGGSGENDPSAVVAKFVKKGNIFVGDNEDIYIYS